MNNKSKLTKLLALVFAFALLATACGSTSDGQSDTATADDDATQSDDTSEEAADDAADDVELTQSDDLLEQIIARGTLNCGVASVSIGFAVADSNG